MKIKIIYYAVWLGVRIVTKLFFGMRIRGSEYVPRSGGFILACNHVSYYDPPLIGSWCRRQLYYVAKAELFRSRIGGWLLPRVNAFPIRRGAFDRMALNTAVEHLAAQRGVIMFPEGTRSRTGDFLSPKAGIGIVAQRAEVPIIPAYLHGSNRLSDCLRGRERLSLTYGKPILPGDYARFEQSKEGYLQLAGFVMKRIAELRDTRDDVK